MPSQSYQGRLRKQVEAQFCILDPATYSNAAIDLRTNLPKPLQQVITDFSSNLESVIHTVNGPFYAVKASTINSAAKLIHFRNASVKEKNELFIAEPEITFRYSLEMLEQRLQEPEHYDDCFSEIYSQMISLLNLEIFAKSNDELKRQSIVMLTGSLEVFFTDFFIELFNSNPRLAVEYLTSPEMKNSTPMKRVELGDLTNFSFDLRNRMGDLIFQNRRVDSLKFLKKIVKIVFKQDLKGAEDKLAKLYEWRHLIVHRRGKSESALLIIPSPADIATALNSALALVSQFVSFFVQFDRISKAKRFENPS